MTSSPSSRRAARGSSPVPAFVPEPDPAPEEAPEREPEPQRSANDDAMIAEVTAAGWKIAVDKMSAKATRDGFGPVIANCSSATEALTIVHRTVCDPFYEPIAVKPAPKPADTDTDTDTDTAAAAAAA